MKIYVLCPPSFVTGGPEYMHQVCYGINKYTNLSAEMLYYTNSPNPQPEIYTQRYNNPYSLNATLTKDDIIIVPEIYAHNPAHDIAFMKIIVWASVNHYWACISDQNLVNNFPSNTYHITQGEYSKDYLINFLKIPKDRTVYITDYISDEFFERPVLSFIGRRRRVLYQGAKTSAFTMDVIKKLKEKDIELFSIENLSTDSIISIMDNSMVFLDFSYHPGKNRMDREAAIRNLCVLTSKQGSAKYYEDIPIPDKYKFDAQKENVDKVINTIEDLINNYNEKVKDFNLYRNKIKNEKNLFEMGIKELEKLIKSKGDSE